MHRREFLAASAAAAAGVALSRIVRANEPPSDFLRLVAQSPSRVLLADGTQPAPGSIRLDRAWEGGRVRSRLMNTGPAPLAVSDIVLFDVRHRLAPDTPVYAEGFTMLSQTEGTLAGPRDISFADRKHYRIPEPDGLRTAYGLIMLNPGPQRILLGFTSCRRFVGRFGFDAQRLRVSVDAEGMVLKPGESWDLEELMLVAGTDRDELLRQLAGPIATNHPRLKHDPPPAGWCSWYWYGAHVTASDITANLDWIARNIPQLKYIQIDDGYQPRMGDWLETGKAFGGDVRGVLRDIRQRGFEPAIWVAPFIASEDSHLFRQHPDWFVMDREGRPLRSDRVGFGGWRMGPWYVLDGTHPDALKHLEGLFRTLRNEWGCTYFKLDANYWGAIHGGRRHDPGATRVEAYRRGMKAILRGAGGDSFILGCNHPLWPSLGLIHGSRSSDDINRSWASFAKTGRENLLRAWQNGRLWWNDPDCAVLVNRTAAKPSNASRRRKAAEPPTDAEYRFHATVLFAAGGLVLSGDDLTRISPEREAMLRKLLPPVASSAQFADEALAVGVTRAPQRLFYCVFNWSDDPADHLITLPFRSQLTDYWTGTDLGRHEGTYQIKSLAGHSAMLIEAHPV